MPPEQPPCHPLVQQFVIAVLQRTYDCPTNAAHAQALQGFLEELTPWITPEEVPILIESPGPLFAHVTFTPNGDGDDEDVAVALSPLGEVILRAWLRQHGVDPALGSS